MTGKPVRHIHVSAAELSRTFTEAGYPAAFADVLAGLDELIGQGAENRTADTVLRLTGRPARSLRTFLQE